MIERVYSWVGRHPYRCHVCEFRFYPGQLKPTEPAKAKETSKSQPPMKKVGKKSDTKKTGALEWERALREWKGNRRSRARLEIQLYGVALAGFLLFLWYIQRTGP